MEVIENKALLFKTRNPDKYNLIPKHKILSESNGTFEILVYWGLEEVQVLRNLGVKDVPSPITGRYGWPGRYRPMSHQMATADFLTVHRRAFVFSEPGTGKTLSALWAADYLMSIGKVRRVLVLCPLSIMQSAWLGDLSSSVIHRSAIVAHHTQASRRIEMVQQDYEFVITNYDGLNLIGNEIKNDGRFDLVIVDEANAYKTPTTKRWKALNNIINQDTRLWMMTGTPASQSPADAYGLAKLVNPNGIPKFFTAWRDKVMNKITMFKWAAKANAPQLVHEALQPAIRFTKAQCLDLPPVLTTTRLVPMTPQQAKYYNTLKDRMSIQAAGETITAVNAAAGLSKLLQISCGAVYTDDKDVVEFDAGPRLAVLEEPLMSVEQYIQCIARADRKGQNSDKVTVIHIESSPVEKKMFTALASKVVDNFKLTQMFEIEINS
jgi:SNF2 family DNA or RNA helicase